jgi:hypothetical protein
MTQEGNVGLTFLGALLVLLARLVLVLLDCVE